MELSCQNATPVRMASVWVVQSSACGFVVRRRFGRGEIHGAARNNGGNGVFVHHLGDGVAQEHNVLIKRLNLTLQLDTVDQINGHRHMLAAQCVEKGILEELAFIAHDILRVQGVLL